MEIQTNQQNEPWLTKAEAAKRLGVSERTIENYAADHRIGAREEPVPGRKARPMFDPDDIARLAAEKNRGAITTNPQEQFGQLAANGAMLAIARIADALTSRPAPPASPRLFMTLDEAESFTGLPIGLLRKLIRQRSLPCARFKDVTYVKTTDLEYMKFVIPADSETHSESVRNTGTA